MECEIFRNELPRRKRTGYPGIFSIRRKRRRIYPKRLKFYKDRFGNCNVPQRWEENTSLGSWVIRQRTYKEYLSPERVSKLNKLRFTWNLYDYLWNQRYSELKEYKKKHGHCEVPKGKGQYVQLADWVSKQRRDYKHKFSRMTPEKIKKLNAIGFRWATPTTPWQERLKELAAFKAQYGRCRVPHRWSENQPLANWVAIQRREHKNHKLSHERFQQLDKLGFLWKVKQRRYNMK